MPKRNPLSKKNDQNSLCGLIARLKIENPHTGKSAYDKISQLMTEMILYRPKDPHQYLYKFMDKHSSKTFNNISENLSDDVKFAKIQNNLFKVEMEDYLENEAEESISPLPNMLEHSFYFELASVGLASHEYARISLAMKQLIERYQFQTVRFWGKMFGTQKNYYIIEAQFEEEIVDEGEENYSEMAEDQSDYEQEDDEDPIPKANYAKLIIPTERNGTGCNKLTYFVCNILGEEWVRLPPVTPAQIQQARLIKRYFTGNLNTSISEIFEGTEINYLRAQIARISASTIISPRGYYEVGNLNGEEEEVSELSANDEFSGYSAFDLLDLSNWVHHVKFILPQGRTKWWNQNVKRESEEAEETEEEDQNKNQKINGMTMAQAEPEYGPEFLSPISNDENINETTLSWSSYLTSNLMSKFSICILKSNWWPGAYSYGIDKKFENIYIGWGQKYSSENYNPFLPQRPLNEYPINSEILEAKDPTAQDEYDFKDMVKELQPLEVNPFENEEEENIDVETARNDV